MAFCNSFEPNGYITVETMLTLNMNPLQCVSFSSVIVFILEFGLIYSTKFIVKQCHFGISLLKHKTVYAVWVLRLEI